MGRGVRDLNHQAMFLFYFYIFHNNYTRLWVVVWMRWVEAHSVNDQTGVSSILFSLFTKDSCLPVAYRIYMTNPQLSSPLCAVKHYHLRWL